MAETSEARAAESPSPIHERIAQNIRRVMRGQEPALRKLLAAFASGGHVLLEDVPGTGKTTMAKALARSVNARYKRIQFTPDLLPTDILGVNVYNPDDRRFRFHQGPIFTNILLADEINRASPRTQSALLEAMAESQVSIDGNLMRLDNLFFVMATQNPVEAAGTYPLPEAQMDRFAMRFSLGYVTAGEEADILLDQKESHPLDGLAHVVSIQDVLDMRRQVSEIRVSDEIRRYVVDLVRATREAPGVRLGASPRASLSLLKTAQAVAMLDGISFVTPDHIQEMAKDVISHRMSMDPQARFSGRTARTVVDEALETIPAPA